MVKELGQVVGILVGLALWAWFALAAPFLALGLFLDRSYNDWTGTYSRPPGYATGAVILWVLSAATWTLAITLFRRRHR